MIQDAFQNDIYIEVKIAKGRPLEMSKQLEKQQ